MTPRGDKNLLKPGDPVKALAGVMEGALEYQNEAVEEIAASGSPDKSEAVELLNAELMRLPEGP